jgi:hypothetical protein
MLKSRLTVISDRGQRLWHCLHKPRGVSLGSGTNWMEWMRSNRDECQGQNLVRRSSDFFEEMTQLFFFDLQIFPRRCSGRDF